MTISFEMIPTIVTPFTKTSTIDYTSLDRLIRYFSRFECDGVFAVCQSSEMFYLDDVEKIELAAHCIQRCHAEGMKCVISGHTQDRIDDQIAFLTRAEILQPDALILISNRMAASDESDGILIDHLSRIIQRLDPCTRLGIYECPYPYKRLLTPEILDFMIASRRFDFIKDTCCRIDWIEERLHRLAGSGIRLYNANAATLLPSVLAGAAGYSGVMLNFIPEIFALLKHHLDVRRSQDGLPGVPDLRTAGALADLISVSSVFEYQNYPANAKYYLVRKGLIDQDGTRNGSKALTDSQKEELSSFANETERTWARYARSSESELLFKSGVHFGQCHASTLLPLKDGTILIAYFAGSREGSSDVGIWLSRRVEGLWQAPVRIAKKDDLPYWNPVLFQSGDTIRLVFKVGTSPESWTSRSIASMDQGRSWSEERALPGQAVGARGPVRCKPLLMSDARLLAPNSVETGARWRPSVDVSEDGGRSFVPLADVPVNHDHPDRKNFMAGKGAIQPSLWESAPGLIHMFLRTTAGSIFRSDSVDFGQTWCEAYRTPLSSNNSGIDVARHGSDLYLVLNPISGNWASRNPLVVKKSTDNGRIFSPFVALENLEFDPVERKDAEFSYPAAIVEGDSLHVSYTCLRREIAYSRIDLHEYRR